MAGSDGPDFVDKLQREDERAARGEGGGLRTLLIAFVVMVLLGWGVVGLWIMLRMRFGRWGRERAGGTG